LVDKVLPGDVPLVGKNLKGKKMESISTKIKAAKNTTELAVVLEEAADAKFASAKTRRRWGRQVEKKTKELSK
jgi:hypothetical protein